MTTERKIEIASKVLGQSNWFQYHSICLLIGNIVSTIDELQEIKNSMYAYYRSIGGQKLIDDYWFSVKMPQTITERINFLEKYIEHLKAQENE